MTARIHLEDPQSYKAFCRKAGATPELTFYKSEVTCHHCKVLIATENPRPGQDCVASGIIYAKDNMQVLIDDAPLRSGVPFQLTVRSSMETDPVEVVAFLGREELLELARDALSYAMLVEG